MTNSFLSRREFLKLGSATLLSVLLADWGLDPAKAETAPIQGRVLATSLIVRDSPSFQGNKLRSVKRDNLLDITGRVHGGAQGDANRTWYALAGKGYVYSGWIQEVKTSLNPLVPSIPGTGVLGELTVPYADTTYGINVSPSPGPRIYYGTTHWITALVQDKRDGSTWYRAYDTALKASYYLQPAWVHLFQPEETAPLSPQVPEDQKHIEIYLGRQLLVAFEWNVPVYAARVATGRKNFETPNGWFRTFHKRPTYHMFGGADEFSVFDLPGVPWDSYITDSGVALHGTYWHNDFGTPHSHGCINMAIPDARWVFRWTQPTVPAGESLVLRPGEGTKVWISRI